MFSANVPALVQADSDPPQPQSIPPIAAAREHIAKLDAKLFWAAYEGCNPEELECTPTKDYRLVHNLASLQETPEAADLQASRPPHGIAALLE